MNPYRIDGPALISFSGGRTSAFMLYQILQAYDGKLPDDVIVAFANTGKEREETLRFVYECGARWGVPVVWLEWREGKPSFERVGYNSASRKGEPFEALIHKKQRLPNWKERWCTEFLKVSVITAFAKSIGFEVGSYSEVIGLRHDEGFRILKSLNNAQFRWDRKAKAEVPRVPLRQVVHPLSAMRVTKADVLRFWLGDTMRMDRGDRPQGFDLGLESWEGNCDLCFLKGRGLRKRIIRDNPGVGDWWAGLENVHNGKTGRSWFDKRDSVFDLAEEVRRSPMFAEDDGEEYDVECGLTCGADE